MQPHTKKRGSDAGFYPGTFRWLVPELCCVKMVHAFRRREQQDWRPAAFATCRLRRAMQGLKKLEMQRGRTRGEKCRDPVAHSKKSSSRDAMATPGGSVGIPSLWIHGCDNAAFASTRQASSRHRHARTKSRPSCDIACHSADVKLGAQHVTAAAMSSRLARCRSSTCSAKGYVPSNSQNSITPTAQMSALCAKLPAYTSGAMNAGVPARCIRRSPSPRRRAHPTSTALMPPSGRSVARSRQGTVTTKFPGLTSPCM
mmetsp:Transcript_28390/g.84066  ORF Transcript_28390/g.84066 Transcript_28390/m.84066 type:complete len:257 (-) Transcript_28390:434-1204(-)